MAAKNAQYEAAGRSIREMRLYSHLTQEELAEKIEVSGPYITLLEAGKRRPSAELCKRICKACRGLNPNTLLESYGWASIAKESRSRADEIRRLLKKLEGMDLGDAPLEDLDDETLEMFANDLRNMEIAMERTRRALTTKLTVSKKTKK